MKTFIPSLSACFGLALCAKRRRRGTQLQRVLRRRRRGISQRGYHFRQLGVDYQANHEMDLTATAKAERPRFRWLYATTYTVGSTGAPSRRKAPRGKPLDGLRL